MLDIRTFIFCNMVTSVFLGAALLFYKTHQKTYSGFDQWMAGSFLIAAGYLAMAVRGAAPLWASVLAANVCFAAVVLLRLDGSLRFIRGVTLPRAWYLVPAAMGMANIYFTAVQNSGAMRNLLLSVVMSIAGCAIAWVCLAGAPARRHAVYRVTGGLHLVFVCVQMARAILWIRNPEYELFQATMVNIVYFTAVTLVDVGVALSFLMMNSQRLETELIASEEHLATTLAELRETMSEMKTLSGLLPICSYCRRIRTDDGSWQQLDLYVKQHTETDFSHGICPECIKTHLPDIAREMGQP